MKNGRQHKASRRTISGTMPQGVLLLEKGVLHPYGNILLLYTNIFYIICQTQRIIQKPLFATPRYIDA